LSIEINVLALKAWRLLQLERRWQGLFEPQS
jgi:hypothetical protein